MADDLGIRGRFLQGIDGVSREPHAKA
jgi:hypothetical protein